MFDRHITTHYGRRQAIGEEQSVASSNNTSKDNQCSSDDGGNDEEGTEEKVDYTYFELRESVMMFLDGHHRVVDDIFAFYDCRTQHSEPVVPELVVVPDAVTDIPESIKHLLKYCRT